MINHFQATQRKRSWFFSPFVLVILLIIAVFLLKSAWAWYQKSRLVVNERNLAYEEWRELDQRRAELEREILSLQTSRGIEEELREKFAIVKPGEKVVSLVEDEATPEVATPRLTLWQKIWQRLIFWKS